MAAAADPSTTDIGKPETPGKPFKAVGKETAPGCCGIGFDGCGVWGLDLVEVGDC
jgi:hypothetical protein